MANRLMQRQSRAMLRDELGRKRCCRGDGCLASGGPWQAETEFHANHFHKDGLESSCKTCRRASQRRKRPEPRAEGCIDCGDFIESTSGKYCNLCLQKHRRDSRRLRPGFVCVDRRHPEWHDGWFSHLEMDEMLKKGYWPEGIRFQERCVVGGPAWMVAVVGVQLGAGQRLEARDG